MAYGLIGLALSAIGTALSIAQASKASSDMNKAALAQLQKIDDQTTQNRPIFEESLAQSSAPNTMGRLARSQEIAESLYGQQAPQAGGALPYDEDLLEGRVGQARQAAALGDSYRDVSSQDWIRNQEVARRLGVSNNLASSAAGVAPILTQLAGNRSAGLAGLGSLMSTAGSLAAIYGGLQAGQKVEDHGTVDGFQRKFNIED